MENFVHLEESKMLMTVSDVAKYLQVPDSRVYDKWREWRIPALRVGNSLRFRTADVELWLEGRRVAA